MVGRRHKRRKGPETEGRGLQDTPQGLPLNHLGGGLGRIKPKIWEAPKQASKRIFL